MSDLDLTENVARARLAERKDVLGLASDAGCVRAQVAAEIEAGLPEARRRREDWIQRQQVDRVLGYTAAIDAIETCARIARGES